jgi:hypothetical protein
MPRSWRHDLTSDPQDLAVLANAAGKSRTIIKVR